MLNRTSLKLGFAALAAALFVSPAQAALVIYEPFANSDPSLTGNPGGTGLTGNWNATAGWDVLAGSLSYGSLPTSGNQVRTDSGGAASIGIGPALASAGLLNDGATLWFSVILTTTPDIGTNPDAGFSIGTDGLSGSNNIPMSNSGSGAGFTVKQGQIRATTWTAGTGGRDNTAAGSEPATAATTYLIVGELIWNANPLNNDTLNIYLPDTSLAKGTVKATRSVVLNQLLFDTISYGQKADSQPGFFDEIRFGSSFNDVIGVSAVAAIPEPATAALGLLAIAGLALRRRRQA